MKLYKNMITKRLQETIARRKTAGDKESKGLKEDY